MPIDIDEIENAWIADIITHLKPTLFLNTVGSFEGSFDEQSLRQSILNAPYTLLQCVDDFSTAKSGKEKTISAQQIFSIVVGCESLQDRREQQKGCYTILKNLKERYDGYNLRVTETASVQLSWQRSVFLLSVPGLLVYQSIFHIPNN